MILAKMMHREAFWCTEEEEGVDQNWIQNSYQSRTNWKSYTYTLVSQGNSNIHGNTNRELLIYSRVLAGDTQQHHISWLIGNHLGANGRCIVHQKVFIGSQDGVICNRQEQEIQKMTGRMTTYYHLPIQTFTMHQMLLDGDI